MQEEDKCKIVSAKEEVFVRRRRCKKRTSARLSPLRKRFLCGGVDARRGQMQDFLRYKEEVFCAEA